MKISILTLLILMCLSHSDTYSQTTKPSTTKSSVTPKLVVTLGGKSTGTLPATDLKQIIQTALIAKDEKGTVYPVIHFRVFYYFNSSSENPDTGEKKTIRDMLIEEFESGAFSELWKKELLERIQKGDEIKIDQVYVKLKNGKKYLAPVTLTFKAS
jgi:hypothetical protein